MSESMSEKPSDSERESAIELSESPDVVDGVVIAESVGSIFSAGEAADSQEPSPVIDTISYFVRDNREEDAVNAGELSREGNRIIALEVEENSKLARVLAWLGDDKLAAAIAEKALVELLSPLAFASKANPNAESVLGELEVAGASSLAYLSDAIDTIEEAIGLSVAADLKEKAIAHRRATQKGEHRYNFERVSKLYKDVYIKDRRRKAKLILNNLETASERTGADAEIDAAIKNIDESCVFELE